MARLPRALATLHWAPPSRDARDTGFMLVLIGWTIAPHLPHLPPWVGALAFAVLLWRAGLAWRQAPLPGRRSVVLLLVLAASLTWWSERTLLGKEAGVILLVVLMALKTLELRARRDALVVFFLGFFLVLTHFLYSQSLPTAVGMALSVWGWLTALTLAHMPAGRPRLWQAARLAGRAALVGTPVMLLLFLLFPRIGPLWSLPADSARTGLSDRLEMGGVADLANDDSIAFRLRFDGPTPPAARLYFRGPVLADSDGHVWRAETTLDPTRPARPVAIDAISADDPALLHYEMTLEPTQLTWLPLLEMTWPAPAGSPPNVRFIDPTDELALLPDVAGQWRTRQPISHRIRLRAASGLALALDAHRSPAPLARYLRLPEGMHPRARAWAAQTLAAWNAAAAQPLAAPEIAGRLLAFIRQENFRYTLSPGLAGDDPVDEFWLDRRAGFCEHFASGFTVVMRAMGVPTRIVTGYQGVDPQREDGELIVRQSYAHAWAEYWTPERGWTRVDPTAAVAPDRIERTRALRPAPGLVGSAFDAMSPGLRIGLRTLWERLDNRWNQWVLGYGRARQFDLLAKLGVGAPDLDDLGRALIGVIAGAALLGALWAAWDARRRSPGQRLWRRLQRSLRALAPLGLQPAAHESPGAFAARLRAALGAAAGPLAARLDALERWRYGPPPAAGAPEPTGPDWPAIAAAARALAAQQAARVATPARA